VRDVASGIFIWVLLANRAPHLLGAFMAAASFIPVGDAVIVLRSGGTRAAAFGIHAREQPMTLPALAMVLDGVDRKSAAETCGMDRQTLRDWVHRYNAEGLRGLHDLKTPGPKPKLTVEQQAELAKLVEAGPDPACHGVVRWRRVDSRDELERRFEHLAGEAFAFAHPARHDADAATSARCRTDNLQLADIQAHHEKRRGSHVLQCIRKTVKSGRHDLDSLLAGAAVGQPAVLPPFTRMICPEI
jgi:transposase-like protein